MEPTKSQARALDTGRSLCVSAGAGAGKTWVLVERYLRLLEKGAKVSQILALTFTDKAAAEMKERVRKALSEKKGEEWSERLEEFNWCSISTFHSFCANLIRQHPLESGTPPRFNVMDDVSSGLMNEEAFQSLLRGEGAKEVEENLVRALTLYGSWKLKERLEYMYERRAEMAPWLELNSSEESLRTWGTQLAERMRREVVVKAKGDAELLNAIDHLARLASTHSGDKDSGQRYLSEAGPIIGRIRQGGTDEEMVQLLQALRDVKGTKAMGSQKIFSPNAKEDLLASYELLLTRLDGLGLETLAATDEGLMSRSVDSLRDLIAVYGVYERSLERSKGEQNVIDYADMIEKAHKLVKQDDGIVAKLRQRYRYLLVDEFQDTDPIQSFIVWAVAGDRPGDRLFIVGDPKQSIYGFRNADVAMFQQAKGRLTDLDPEASVHLDVNFRSSPQVVRFVNHVFSQLMQDEGKDYQFRYEAMEMSPERTNDPGSVELLLAGKKKADGAGEVSQMSEAEMVASRIEQVLSDGRKLVFVDKCGERLAEGRRPEPGDVAILLRARTHLKLFEKELRDRNIPYHVHKGLGFFERQEILDVYNVLGFLADHGDDVSLYGLLRSPYFAFSDEELYFICRSQGADMWMRLRNAAEKGNERAKQAVSMLDSWSRRAGRVPVAELLRHVQTDSGIYAVYAAQPNGDQLLSNLEKLNAKLRDSAGDGVCTPRQAVDWIGKAMRLAKLEGEAPMESSALDAVNIMTVHASKGLEFPIVFVPELGQGVSGKTPSVLFDKEMGLGITVLDESYKLAKDVAYGMIEAVEASKSAEETKRLLYVAMTRARDHLFLSGKIGKEERKVVTWMDLLLSALPGGAIPDDVADVRITSEVDMAVVRPDDMASSLGDRKGPMLFQPCAQMSSMPEWSALPTPSRRTSLTITGLKAFESYPERFLSKDVYGEPEGWLEKDGVTDAKTFGNAAHEVLRGRDPGAVVRRMGLDARRVEELERIRADFERSIAGRSYDRTCRELKFQMEVGGQRFSGAVDRADRNPQGTWMVTDFKTVALPKGGRNGPNKEHEDQVRAYVSALNNALHADVGGSLYFTSGGTSVDVPAEPGYMADLEKRVRRCAEAVRKAGSSKDEGAE